MFFNKDLLHKVLMNQCMHHHHFLVNQLPLVNQLTRFFKLSLWSFYGLLLLSQYLLFNLFVLLQFLSLLALRVFLPFHAFQCFLSILNVFLHSIVSSFTYASHTLHICVSESCVAVTNVKIVLYKFMTIFRISLVNFIYLVLI